jgi:hypothetical protein
MSSNDNLVRDSNFSTPLTHDEIVFNRWSER